MTKIKALIQKNNQLRLALNTENRQFYNDLLLYMRCQSITRNEEIVEKQLLVILEDILDAQQDHISAETYFGKNVKTIADELMVEIPRNFLGMMRFLLLGMGAYIIVFSLPSLLSHDAYFDIGTILLAASYFVVLIGLLFRNIGNTIYTAKINYTKRIMRWSIWTVGFAGGILISILVKTPLQIKFSGWLVLSALTILVIAYLLLKNRQQNHH
ncbi:hypothetical protein [Latilactobacillus sakei]|uniref:hypothetical protein n=1 Tax=Latilactobacillus sakei TaxID=1599 RepID=UPI000690B930